MNQYVSPQDIPYGPLTRKDYERLSNSFLDASQTDAHLVADQRGIKEGEASLLRFQEKLRQRALENPEFARRIFASTDTDSAE